jgi:hypothetical protein
MSRQGVLFITVVPSPYQRDLFRELAKREEMALLVWYLEATSPDSRILKSSQCLLRCV